MSNIASQISSMQGSLSSASSMLSQRQEEVTRLKRCLQNLDDSQSDFVKHTSYCEEPVLSSSTWHGEYASKFKKMQISGYRGTGILLSYKELSEQQLERIIESVQAEIQKVNAQISSIQSRIHSMDSQLSSLREQQKKEVANT